MTPDSLESELQAAIETHSRGERERARDQFASIISRHPACHQALFMHGSVSSELGDLPTAEAAIRRALESVPDEPRYMHRLSRIVLRQRRPIEAAELIERMLNTVPSIELWIELANIRLSVRQFAFAAGAFRNALNLDPLNVSAGAGLVLALTGEARLEEAVDEAKKFAERCPASAEAHARLAMLLERLGRADEARPAAERAVAIDPAHGLGLFALGNVLLRQNKHEAALTTLQRALSHATEPHDQMMVTRAIALTLDGLGRYDEAFAHFVRAKPTGTPAPAVLQMIEALEQFLDANRTSLDPWSIASWGESPPYIAFSTPPVFIVGFPCSGTTLVERLISARGEFLSTDEYPTLAKLREHIQRHAGGNENVPRHLGVIGVPEVRLIRAMYFKEVEGHLAGLDPIGKRLVDRNPINLGHLAIVRRIFPDAPVIVCLRDPRDAILSAFMRQGRHATAAIHFATLESAANFYISLMGLWPHLREVLGMRYLEVKYEDLVTRTEAECTRMMQFLGAPSAAVPYSTEPMHQTGIGRWRHYRAHFDAALEKLRPLAVAFGYPAD